MTAAPERRPLPYMPQVDGLRAFAVFGVMATHFGNSELPGYLGVRLFFVLSGFLITSLLLKSKDTIERGDSTFRAQLARFYARRVLRLYPPLLVFLGVCVLFDLGPARSTWLWHASYLSNILFSIRDQRWFHLALLWSLSIEEQFYLVWPLLVFTIPRRFMARTCIAAIATGVLWRTLAWFGGFRSIAVDVLPFNALSTLGMGALLAVAMSSSTPQAITAVRLKKLGSGIGLWAFVIMVALYAFKPGTGVQFICLDIATATVFTWIVAIAARGAGGLFGKILERPPIVYVGKISYGIYLYHIFVSGLADWTFRQIGVALPTSAIIQFIIFVPVSIALASLSWLFLERPVMRLRRYLSYDADGVMGNRWRGDLSGEAVA